MSERLSLNEHLALDFAWRAHDPFGRDRTRARAACVRISPRDVLAPPHGSIPLRHETTHAIGACSRAFSVTPRVMNTNLWSLSIVSLL